MQIKFSLLCVSLFSPAKGKEGGGRRQQKGKSETDTLLKGSVHVRKCAGYKYLKFHPLLALGVVLFTIQPALLAGWQYVCIYRSWRKRVLDFASGMYKNV